MDSAKIRLTQRSIASLAKKYEKQFPTGKNRVEVRDDKQPGLQLHFTRTGQPTYYLVKFLRGRFRRVRIGTVDDYGPEDARDKAEAILTELKEGKVVVSEHPSKAPAGTPTLHSLIEECSRTVWSKNKQPGEPRKLVHRYMKPKLSWPLSDFSRIGAREFLQQVGEDNGPYASNRLRTVLIRAWREAQVVYDFADNPWQLTEKFDEASRTRRLSEAEMGRTLKVLDKWKPRPLVADVFLTLLWTGARKSNVFQMRKDELDFSSGFWTIPAAKAKASVEIRVPLVKELVPVLKRNIKTAGERPWVFKTDKSLTEPPKDLYKPWAELTKKAKLKDYRIHDQRRTLASFMADCGCPESVLDMVLSHGEPKNATGIYTRPQLKTLREWMEKAVVAMEACR